MYRNIQKTDFQNNWDKLRKIIKIEGKQISLLPLGICRI